MIILRTRDIIIFMNNKKLTKLKLNLEKVKEFLKSSELVPVVADAAIFGAGLAVSASGITGISGALMGIDTQSAALASGLMSAGLSATANLTMRNGRRIETNKRQKKALFAAGLAATALSTGLGAGLGAWSHKFATAALNEPQPEPQIEQTVTTAPVPVIDALQVQ